MGVLEGEGGGGAVLPGLGAEVVVEARAGGHGLGVEVGGERAILRGDTSFVSACVLPSALPFPHTIRTCHYRLVISCGAHMAL